MKKRISIIVGIIILLLIGIFIYSVFSDLKQEEKLKAELSKLNEMLNIEQINTEEIYQKLNQTVTTGAYAKVEKAFKNYLKDNFDISMKIVEILNDDRITTLLTVKNYQDDGKEFIETKKYITDTKIELETCKKKYLEFYTKEKAMSYIQDEKLDDYYINLYEEKLVGDIEATNADQTVENSINDIIEILNISEKVIELLSNNQNSWNITEESIYFTDDNLSNQYNSLLENLS